MEDGQQLEAIESRLSQIEKLDIETKNQFLHLEKRLDTLFEKVKEIKTLQPEQFKETINGLEADVKNLRNASQNMVQQMSELTERLNLAFDEIRSVGGKKLDKIPATRLNRALSLLELVE